MNCPVSWHAGIKGATAPKYMLSSLSVLLKNFSYCSFLGWKMASKKLGFLGF